MIHRKEVSYEKLLLRWFFYLSLSATGGGVEVCPTVPVPCMKNMGRSVHIVVKLFCTWSMKDKEDIGLSLKMAIIKEKLTKYSMKCSRVVELLR